LEKKGMAETLAVTLKLGKKTAGRGVEKTVGVSMNRMTSFFPHANRTAIAGHQKSCVAAG
jgi:hypothetical protein